MNSKTIKEKALQVGYTACGIIPAKPFEEYRKSLDERIAAYPQSKKAYDDLAGLVNPPEGAKSIIVCVLGYSQYKTPKSLAKSMGKHYLFDGRLTFSKEFRANAEFETFLKVNRLGILDGGVPDRWAAVKAGLGKFGRNNFFYSDKHGSYAIVHTWSVEAELEYDADPKDYMAKECSEGCLSCVAACPTKAMTGSLMMDRCSCAAQLTFDSDTHPNAEQREQMGSWMYGCDVCQDVCPMNDRKMTESENFPLMAEYEEFLQPENVLEMDEDTYKNILNPRFFYLGESGLWKWKCNALRVLVNEGDTKYHPLIKKYSHHEDSRIREVAEWGCKKLGL